MSSIPSSEEMRANLPCHQSILDAPPEEKMSNSQLEISTISIIDESLNSLDQKVVPNVMEPVKSDNGRFSSIDQPFNIKQDVQVLQSKVKAIDSELCILKTEFFKMLKSEPKLKEGDFTALTKASEDRILKVECELQDMMVLVLELCDSFPKDDSTTVSQCNSRQLHTMVKLELETLTKEVISSNKKALKSFEKISKIEEGKIKRLKDALNAEKNRNDKLEKRLQHLENASKSIQTSTKSNEQKKAVLNTNVKSAKSTGVRSKEENVKKEYQKTTKTVEGIKDVNMIPQEEKNPVKPQLSSVKSQLSSVKSSSTKRPATTTSTKTTKDSHVKISNKFNMAKSGVGSQKDASFSAQKKLDAKISDDGISKNTQNDSDKSQNYLLSDSQSGVGPGQLKDSSVVEPLKFINKNEIINDPVLSQAPLIWAIRKHFKTETATKNIQHGRVFFSNTPGYRLQLRAEIDRLHGDIYFSVRVMKGPFDDQLSWPCNEKFKICITDRKSRPDPDYQWIIPNPDTSWNLSLRKLANKGDQVHSEWVGPFNISHFITRNVFKLQVSLAS